jgi:hypothetical protein
MTNFAVMVICKSYKYQYLQQTMDLIPAWLDEEVAAIHTTKRPN